MTKVIFLPCNACDPRLFQWNEEYPLNPFSCPWKGEVSNICYAAPGYEPLLGLSALITSISCHLHETNLKDQPLPDKERAISSDAKSRMPWNILSGYKCILSKSETFLLITVEKEYLIILTIWRRCPGSVGDVLEMQDSKRMWYMKLRILTTMTWPKS